MPLDAVRELGREVRLADHAEEGAGGIGVGEDDVGGVAAAVDGAHARRRPVLDLDLGDFAVGGDLDPVLAIEGGDRLRDAAHPAAHEAPGALVAVDAADQVVVLDIRGAGRHGTGVDADHAAGGERRLDLLGLEVLVEKLGDALAGQRPPVFLALRPGEARLDLIPGRRRLQQQRPHPLHDAVPHRPVGVVGGDVALGELGDLLSRLAPVEEAHEIGAVGEGDEVLRIEGADVVAVSLQLQVRDHLWQQQIADVGAGREAVAREPLLGDGGAADDRAPLQHEHLFPGLGQVARGDEPVVTRADDDRVVAGAVRRRTVSRIRACRGRHQGSSRCRARAAGRMVPMDGTRRKGPQPRTKGASAPWQ